jgi:curved DNA-binding protein
MASPDYYEILGVSLAAGQDNIKAAFRRLARERHPDKNPDAPNATAKFQLVCTATKMQGCTDPGS